jgi:adenine-specific DNA-methyltransferase
VSTNVSKLKRDDLIDKIGRIRSYISAAQQDTNTGNLLHISANWKKTLKARNTG